LSDRDAPRQPAGDRVSGRRRAAISLRRDRGRRHAARYRPRFPRRPDVLVDRGPQSYRSARTSVVGRVRHYAVKGRCRRAPDLDHIHHPVEVAMGRAALWAVIIAACAHQAPLPESVMAQAYDKLCLLPGVEYDDPALAAYVTQVGRRVVHANGDRRPWTFRVLDDDYVQAYAGVGTTAYLTRGALARLRSEAELAA